MRLTIYTGRLSYAGPDRVDVTRAGVDEHYRRTGCMAAGEPFAPSWALLGPALDARKAGRIAEYWPAYAESYRSEMRASLRGNPSAWRALLDEPEVTLCCGCRDPRYCHRTILANLVAAFARSKGVEVVMAGEQGADAMRAISLWQPWASEIAVGAKTLETRSWGTAYRGVVAIHAAKTRQAIAAVEEHARKVPGLGRVLLELAGRPGESCDWRRYPWPLGCVVAVAELAQCWQVTGLREGLLRDSAGRARAVAPADLILGDLSPGRFAWVLANIRPFREPVPCRGMQGLFSLPADVEVKVRAQLDQAENEAERTAIAEEGAGRG